RVSFAAALSSALASPAFAEEANAPLPSPGVFLSPTGALTMAPIPDEVEIKEPAVVVVANAGLSDEAHCLATAIYFEARGESQKGQRAVAEVILARTRTPGRPKTVCGVVFEGSNRRTGCQFSFTCDGRSDVARGGEAWTQAQRVAKKAIAVQSRAKG